MKYQEKFDEIGDCNHAEVWDMICSGDTKGVFQVESKLGQQWCIKCKPRSIDELSDVISLIRPGVLLYVYDGKSMAQHYADRKNGEEDPTPLHESLGEILSNTYQVVLYQEQIIAIAKTVAGFTGGQADYLRKAIGKKDAALLLSIEEKFIEGCVTKGIVNKDTAMLIFDNIKKSARYLFCAAHAVSYAYDAYLTAYEKCFNPERFYLNKLRFAKEKIDPDREKSELITSARNNGIEIVGPSIKRPENTFFWNGQAIQFGLADIKNVGNAHVEKLRSLLKEEYNWTDILIKVLPYVNKRAVEHIIKAGAVYGYGKSRGEMLHEYTCISLLKEKELIFMEAIYDRDKDFAYNLELLLSRGTKSNGGGFSTVTRLAKGKEVLNKLQTPGRSLKDNPALYAKVEEDLLGVAMSCSVLDGSVDAGFANTTCKEISNGKLARSTLAVIVKEFREFKTKNGELMSFLKVSDNTGDLENIVIFPNVYSTVNDIIYNDATLLLTGEVKDKVRKSFIVESVFAI